MSLSTALTTYLTLNLLLAMGCAGLLLYALALKALRYTICPRAELRCHYSVAAALLLLILLQPLLPVAHILRPAARIWAAPSSPKTLGGGATAYITLKSSAPLRADYLAESAAVLSVLVLLWGSFYLLRDLRRLRRLQTRSFLLRQIGRVRLAVNSEVRIPFSYWLPEIGRAHV